MVNEYLDELEVHPPHLYGRLVEQCLASAGELLQQPDQFIDLAACPACDSTERLAAFEKHGYGYWLCQTCKSLYVSPRPSGRLLDQYLFHSTAAAFRNSSAYRQALGQRARAMAAYRADWVVELCRRRRGNAPAPVIDVETRSAEYPAVLQQRLAAPLVLARPLDPGLASLPADSGGAEVVEQLAGLAGRQAQLMSGFDILEHQANPLELVQAAYAALRPGGLLVLTTRSASGFDIQILWQYANIFPVEHINLFSIEGMQLLLTRNGFEIIEASTPGQLDVQIIERVWREQPQVELPRFLRYFLANRDQPARQQLQQFLQQNRLSSHLRLVAKKS